MNNQAKIFRVVLPLFASVMFLGGLALVSDVKAEKNEGDAEWESPSVSTVATYKDIEGKVIDAETLEPAPGAQVSLLSETTIADSEGRFRFEKVPVAHNTQVSLRIKSKMDVIIGCMTLEVPSRFYPVAAVKDDKLAVDIVRPDVLEGEFVLKLEQPPAGPIDSYCEKCHGSNPCLETTTYQEVLKSKADMRGIIVMEDKIEEFSAKAASKGFNKEAYEVLRYQDTHPKGFDIKEISMSQLPKYKGLYQISTSLKFYVDDEDEENKIIVSCDTCHTRHMPTSRKYYIVMPYEEDNGLCIECHL